MEIEILEEGKNKTVLKIKGEAHTLVNSLRKELWNVKGIKAAGYAVEHPTTGIYELIVETESGNPKDAILAAAKNLKKQNTDFLKAVQKELK